MIRKITNEDRRSDIIAARDAWESEYDAQQAEYRSQEDKYRNAMYDVADALEARVKELIGNTTLHLDIRINDYARGGGYGVKVVANAHNLFDENVALSWTWSVSLDGDGDVKKESSSWSDMNATTPKQLADLEETLRVLKLLNSIDWVQEIGRANGDRPNIDDYITTKSPSRRDRPDFEAQLKAATIEDIIGTNTLIQADGNETRGQAWYLITRETAKQYEVVEFSRYSIENHKNDLASFVQDMKQYTNRIAKDRFLSKVPKEPETITF